jgi:Rieske Fe-S protein
VAPLLVFIYPPAEGNKKQQLQITLDKALDQIQNGDGVQFNAPKNSAFVMYGGGNGSDNAPGDPTFGGYAVKDQNGQLHVFAIRCPHLGCSIALKEGANKFACPCHGSEFALDGKVTHGPAVADLSYLKWQQGQAGNQISVEGMELPGLG